MNFYQICISGLLLCRSLNAAKAPNNCCLFLSTFLLFFPEWALVRPIFHWIWILMFYFSAYLAPQPAHNKVSASWVNELLSRSHRSLILPNSMILVLRRWFSNNNMIDRICCATLFSSVLVRWSWLLFNYKQQNTQREFFSIRLH